MSETRPMIPIARPLLDESEVEAVRRVIMSGWVTQGPEVAAFEREFADFVGAPHACAVSNCTTALHLALKAVGVGAGDEVVTVSHSFIATANAIRHCAAVPVFIDIEDNGFNMDPDLIEAAITGLTRAIVCVHQIGMPCNLSRILEIAAAHGLPVIEDAACAIGSEINLAGNWRRIGAPIADIACFSFHPRKLITTGDGGMLTTANPEYDHKFRLWRQHGMSVSDTTRHSARDIIFESYVEPGYNYRMTDLQAAVGRAQLRKLPAIIEGRRRLAARYGEALADIPGLTTPFESLFARSNWQSYCVRLPAIADQRRTMQALLDSGISTRRGVMNIHLEPAYADTAVFRCASGLKNSEVAQSGSIILPLYGQMSEQEFSAVVDGLHDTLGRRCAA